MFYLFLLAIAAGLFLIDGIQKEKFIWAVMMLIVIILFKGIAG